MPCDHPCSHPDCIEDHDLALSDCGHCGWLLGYDPAEITYTHVFGYLHQRCLDEIVAEVEALCDQLEGARP